MMKKIFLLTLLTATALSLPAQTPTDTLRPSLSQDPHTVKGAVYAHPQADPAARALDLIGRLTFQEKLAFTGSSGGFNTAPVARLGIRPVQMADASQGVRGGRGRVAGSTSFPCTQALAATWNVDLANRYGAAIGEECRAFGIDLLLGPGINMQRLSVGGRNFECMGEDPWLTARLATAYIKGMQATGIIAVAKHFVGNDEEFCRHIANSQIGERALREIYLPPWEYAIKEGKAQGMMTGNNILNNIPVMMNKPVMTDIIRREFGFTGITMTDWQNTFYHPKKQNLVLPSGETLLMPQNETFRKWVHKQAALSDNRKNEIEILLEHMIFPTIYTLFKAGVYDRDFIDPAMCSRFAAHKQVARRTAQEGIVLLKNEKRILPILPGKKQQILLMGEEELYGGEGSGFVPGYDHVSFEAGLRAVYGDRLTCQVKPDDATVRAADIVLFRLSKRCGENRDVPFDEPKAALDELRRIARLNKNVVVLAVAANTIPTDWLGRVKGFVWCNFLGQERGHALADVLSGAVSPSGKLPFTMERSFADSPDPEFNYLGGAPFWKGSNGAYRDYWLGTGKKKPAEQIAANVKPGQYVDVSYKEGIFVGYRWYDTRQIPVVYPFGFGLSYTAFAFSNLQADNRLTAEGKVVVTLDVRNTGKQAGAEVVQLYVSDDTGTVERPLKELKAFGKVELQPGESKRVTLTLDTRSFAYWDVTTHTWRLPQGKFTLRAGNASNNLPLTAVVEI